jgi:lipase chaperone LimK
MSKAISMAATAVLALGAGLLWMSSDQAVDLPDAGPGSMAASGESGRNSSGGVDSLRSVTAEYGSELPVPSPASVVESGNLSVEDYEARSAYGRLPEHMRSRSLPRLYHDPAGHLLVTKEIMDVIEQLLMAANDEPLEQVLARIDEYIAMMLPEPAAAEARAIVDQYLAYRDAADVEVDFDPGQMDIHSIIDKMDAKVAERKRLRREMLPPEVVVEFFDEDERYDDFSLARARIMNDPALSESEKDARVAQAEQNLPPHVREREQRAREKRTVENRIAALRKEGDKETEIHALRVDFYGEETANRMAYFDDNSTEWVQRVSDFNQQHEQIMALALDDGEKDRMVEELRASMFSPREQVKLGVYNIRQMARNP